MIDNQLEAQANARRDQPPGPGDEAMKMWFEAVSAVEHAVMGEGQPGVWPDWIYEARAAVKKHREANPAWLPDLLAILGWQGGTVHQALVAVRRLVEAEKDRLREFGCGYISPHHGDLCCGGRVQAPNAQFTIPCPQCSERVRR